LDDGSGEEGKAIADGKGRITVIEATSGEGPEGARLADRK